MKTKKTHIRRHRSKRAQHKWLPWGLGATVLLMIVLLVGNSLRKPGTDEPGSRSYEALYGVQGVIDEHW